MQHYIYHIPLFLTGELEEGIALDVFCTEIEELIPPRLLKNIDAVYIGEFPELQGRNAAYINGAIYMTSKEPTNFDMVENFVHEVAHSLEETHGLNIFTSDLKKEFLGKRHRLYHLLQTQDLHTNPKYYAMTQYNAEFDNFLSQQVGYPTLLSLTSGLFVSPYGATSLPEYFANGFEKYYLDSPRAVKKISPVLYGKIVDIVDDHA